MAELTLATFPYSDDLKLDTMVRDGIPVKRLRELRDFLDVETDSLARALGIPRRTLERRLSSTGSLPLDEGDRTVRLGRLVAHALEVFEDRHAVARWFKSPVPALGGVAPFDLCATDAGGRAVALALGHIEHGVFA